MSIHAGGHSGPPLRGACVLNSLINRWNLRRDVIHPPRKRTHSDSTLHTATTNNLIRAGGHRGPLRRGIHQRKPSHPLRNQRDIAMRGGMWSGWAASRTFHGSLVASQDAFGGWQGGYRPRWPLPTSITIFLRAAIGDGRPTSPADVTS